MRSVRAALIQTRTPQSQGEALEHIAPMIEEAVVGGAELIVTPEGSNLLQRSKAKFTATAVEPEHDVFVQGMAELARGHGVHVLIGSALVKREDGLFANRSMLLTPTGEVAATYDKIHMFDVDLPTGETHRESALYAPGDRAVTAQTLFGKVGLTICYDVRFPHLYRALARAGAEIITVPAAFTVPTGRAHWEILLRARAIETGSFILAPAQGGTHEDGRSTYGRSIAIAPWGEVLALADHDEPGVVFADLDLDAVAKARGAVPNLINGRDFTGP
jgi:deaminated glutathione amidase